MGHIIGIWDISWGYGIFYRDIDGIYHRNMGYITGLWIGIWDIDRDMGHFMGIWDIL